MENIVERVLDIDRKAQQLREETEKIARLEEGRLRGTLQRMESAARRSSRESAEAEYDRILRESDSEAARLKVSREELVGRLNEVYEAGKEELLREFTEKILRCGAGE